MIDTGRGSAPAWAKKWLIAAGVYNLAWGAVVIVFPNVLFDFADMQRPLYPQIWQCVGMIVGVYGIGYLAAAADSRRHWPIVMVGLLGKIFGPIGFAAAMVKGDLPPAFGVTILTNDLIWWVPFSMMLWDAAKAHSLPHDQSIIPLDEAMRELVDTQGRSLDSLSNERDLLVVFTRHSGCTFCKEMLGDLSKQQDSIRKSGVALAIVTMSDPGSNLGVASQFGLTDASWISDPEARGYRAFGLGRGRFMQVFGPSVWFRGLLATLRGHRVSRLVGDGFQMPGAFLVRDGMIKAAHRHATAAERVNLGDLSCGVPTRA